MAEKLNREYAVHLVMKRYESKVTRPKCTTEAASCHWHPILIRVVISRSTWNIYVASVEIMLGIGAECIKVYIIITYMGFPQLLLLPITKYSKELLYLLF